MSFHVVDIEAAPAAREQNSVDEEQLIALEFSEIGRSPRFLPGWYVLPAAVMIGVVAAGLAWALR